jgi:SlyX protein
MAMTDEQRIDMLEGVVSHQQRMLDEINDVVTAQAKELGDLRTRLETLVSRFLAVEEAVQPDIPVDKPPHW